MTTLELGESLKKFRKNYNLSQEKMAKDMGISRTMYKAYESGRSAPSIIILANLADVYHVSLDYLTGRDFSNSDNQTPKIEAEPLTVEERLAKLEATVAKLSG